MSAGTEPPQGTDFLKDGGEMGALMRGHDWSASPLGDPSGWPQSLRAIVGLMINSRYPMFVAWGPELAFLYNDGYAPIFGAKHPHMLGRPFREAWPEIWGDISPLVDSALAGEATYHENLHLVMERNGYPEDTWYNFSYSPVRDESGAIAGMFCACQETTGQVLADKRRNEDAERQQRLFEQAPGFIAILRGPDHVFEFANESYYGLVGRRDLIGKTMREALPDIEGQGYYELLDKVYETGERFAADNVVVSLVLEPGAEPEEQFVNFIYEPVIDEAGKVTGIFTEGYNVTEANRAARNLRESEERYRSLFGTIDAGFCIVEMKFDDSGRAVDYRFVEVNPAFERQTGIMDAPGKWMRDIAPPHEQHWFDTYGRVALTGEAARFESPAAALHDRWYDVHAYPIGAPGEHRVAILFNDISDRRRAEQKMRETADELQTVLDAMPAAVWIARDPEAKEIVGNRASYELLRVAPGRNQSLTAPSAERPIGFKIYKDDRELAPHELPVQAAARGEVIEHFEEEIRFDDGVTICMYGNAVPLRDVTGDVRGAVAAFVDVTDLKQAEAALRDLNETLERHVEERTRELMQAQEALRQSQKLEAMGQLTGGVAHDFNNLLSPILGSLDLLHRRGLGDEREQRLIDGALQSAERAKTLVQRLLAFARRQPLQPRPVDVGQLVAGMADLVASTSGPQIKVKVGLAEDVPAALADPNQLEMAILNLSVNARDAMPDGGTLNISTACDEVGAGHRSGLLPGSYVRLSIADTGSGMDEATLARAIEPFFSTKGIGKGTGLGLSMVHGLASQLGGALLVSSKPGLGTNVELWLPVSETDAARERAPSEPADRQATGVALLVDDEELVRMSTADMLADLGYEVIEAASAEEALRLFDDGRRIDLLITDHLMPGMTGADLAGAIRARKADFPILIVSGYAEAEGLPVDVPRLTKPFRQTDLSAGIARLNAPDA